MLWRWIALLAMMSSLSVSGARGQQPGRPTATDSTQSEISTRSTDAAIKVRVNLVLVRVVVREAGGKVVAGLDQEDFQVFDKGRRQKISSFSVETTEKPGENGAAAVTEKVMGAEAPEAGAGVVHPSAMAQRFLALVFDDSHLKAADAMAVHSATKKLFAGLAPTDRVAIYSTHGDVQQDFTSDAQTLRKTLAAIVPHPAKGAGDMECPNITYYQADLIVNKHDRDAAIVAALDAAANECPVDVIADADRILQEGDSVTMDSYQRMEDIVKNLASMPGQRVLVYVSPGFVLPDGVMPDHWGFIQRALRAGVVVNTIDARGLYTADALPDIDAPPQQPPPPPPLDSSVGDYQSEEGKYRMQAQFESGQVLAGIAAGTGGRFFHNRNDLDVAMSQALAAPEVSYVLGFRPQQQIADGKFHNLKVKLADGKKYQIQATNGYYASKKPVDPEEAAKQEVREDLYSREEMAGVPVDVSTQVLKAGATSTQISVLTHLDISGLRFRRVDGKNCNDLVLATALFDANGRLVDGQMKEVALKLEDSTLAKISQTGLTLKVDFAAKPGTYRIRSVVRDSERKQLTARNLMTTVAGEQPTARLKNVSFQNLKWAPPKVDASLKSAFPTPACDLSEVLKRTAVNALALATNLEKFTAEEHIDYSMLDRAGMVEQYDSGTFQFVYSIEQQDGKSVSREYRSPIKGSHVFRAAEQEVGGAAIALMFLPDLQSDYEMRCEGSDERNGQMDCVVHFEQRKDRPSRTAKVWANGVAHPGMFKGRAWISKENFQVVHLEAGLMDGVPDIGLEEMTFSVDYGLVQSTAGKAGFWLPNAVDTYWDFDAHRSILAHRLDDFQLFTVETKEEVQEPKKP
jgi:VWFA-related protein